MHDADMIAPWKDDVIMFAFGQREKFQPRDDYCELLQLVIIFLGGTPHCEYGFGTLAPFTGLVGWQGPLYSIKMWLFYKQYEPL